MGDIVAETKALLSTTVVHWNSLVTALPEDMLTRPATAGEWSAAQCMMHLLDTEVIFQVRLKVFLDGGEGFPAFDPDSEGSDYSTISAADLVAEFISRRTDSMALLEQIKPEHLGRVARHAELGPVTLEQLLNEWAAHDLNHTVQAERAIMQAFIPGSGPWRGYFKDHDLGEVVQQGA